MWSHRPQSVAQSLPLSPTTDWETTTNNAGLKVNSSFLFFLLVEKETENYSSRRDEGKETDSFRTRRRWLQSRTEENPAQQRKNGHIACLCCALCIKIFLMNYNKTLGGEEIKKENMLLSSVHWTLFRHVIRVQEDSPLVYLCMQLLCIIVTMVG